MKILHTSDWHLGKYLYRKKRYDEFKKFLDWLYETIETEKIDALLVAGDIFDNTTPSNSAQNLYYKFLAKVSQGYCSNIVITAGNHDSPSFLDAPYQVLEALNIFVISSADDDTPEKEIVVLKDKNGKPEAVVCAVPFLRERDIRKSSTAGETSEDKENQLLKSIKEHYRKISSIGEEKIKKIEEKEKRKIPLITMGHLFTSGGSTTENDGVRELYIGNIKHISPDIFSSSSAYTALGHLHIPQTAGGKEDIRYSGSPLPMNFGEAEQNKSVVIIEFNQEMKKQIVQKPVPEFQKLIQIKGSFEHIIDEIEKLKMGNSNAWLEIEYTGKEIIAGLKDELDKAAEDTNLEILRVINKKVIDKVLSRDSESETLETLTETEVFIRRLDAEDMPEEQKNKMLELYKEVLLSLDQEPEER